MLTAYSYDLCDMGGNTSHHSLLIKECKKVTQQTDCELCAIARKLGISMDMECTQQIRLDTNFKSQSQSQNQSKGCKSNKPYIKKYLKRYKPTTSCPTRMDFNHELEYMNAMKVWSKRRAINNEAVCLCGF